MKQNIIQTTISFIMKYIWLLCALLILGEIASVSYTTTKLIQQSAISVLQSVSGDISSRVDGVLRLLMGMANDPRFADTSKPLFDRVTQALPYQESYNLYMIAMTDQEVNVISADETEPPTTNYSLAHRDYLQRLYATGTYQITDAFLSGDGKETMNYTIAVPILYHDVVEGSIFGSIYFNDIKEILQKQSQNQGRNFYLLGADHTVMASDDTDINAKSFLELSESSFFFQTDATEINENMKAGVSGSFWEFDKEGLAYVTYQRVSPSNWTIVYRVQFLTFFAQLLPVLVTKITFFILMCTGIYIFGQKYLNQHLSQINHLLNRMAMMQKELFKSESSNYDEFLELTQQGLSDQLTGLPTRAMFFQEALRLSQSPNWQGAVLFIDLDDLKQINDEFGHKTGDYAITCFANTLSDYAKRHDGLVARYGGDEFILVLQNMDVATATQVANQLCRDLQTVIEVDVRKLQIHGSIGVSFFPSHGTSIEDLIGKADLALYSAKQEGKSICKCYIE